MQKAEFQQKLEAFKRYSITQKYNIIMVGVPGYCHYLPHLHKNCVPTRGVWSALVMSHGKWPVKR